MSPSGRPPTDYAFLSEIGSSLSLRLPDGERSPFALTVELHYSAALDSSVEFDDDTATIRLDVRFVETVIDFISCLNLHDARASGARALLLVHGMALDLALCTESQPALVAGLVQDYIVSRTTAECEIPLVTHPDVDFSGKALRSLAEKAGLYIAAHELAHWQLARDPDYRHQELHALRRHLENIVAHAEDDTYRAVYQRMAGDVTEATGDTLPLRVEEWLCDAAAARALAGAVTTEASREMAETTVYAANIMLWTRARLRRLLAEGPGGEGREIDRAHVLERGAMSLFALLSPRVADAPTPSIPTDHLERLEQLTEQAVAGFLDGQNVIRLLGIGTVGTTFGLTSAEQVRETIARVRDWI